MSGLKNAPSVQKTPPCCSGRDRGTAPKKHGPAAREPQLQAVCSPPGRTPRLAGQVTCWVECHSLYAASPDGPAAVEALVPRLTVTASPTCFYIFAAWYMPSPAQGKVRVNGWAAASCAFYPGRVFF
ncbi:hypothetical protein NDU88_004832 [Pleurodeles waltl]|uniref:Uncharacterized protein n=1 Tax=Pleurodeles waltl TaxID=8319 RepID=A0AAV7SJY0_PLEWA|nr:hypothetical protein NDU88_004832 [Pleurodeles waltl]